MYGILTDVKNNQTGNWITIYLNCFSTLKTKLFLYFLKWELIAYDLRNFPFLSSCHITSYNHKIIYYFLNEIIPETHIFISVKSPCQWHFHCSWESTSFMIMRLWTEGKNTIVKVPLVRFPCEKSSGILPHWTVVLPCSCRNFLKK